MKNLIPISRLLELCPPRRELVKGLIHEYSVNVVAGPSGAGKYRWLIPFLQDWLKGSWQGRACIPFKRALYYVYDRGSSEFATTYRKTQSKLPNLHIQSFTEEGSPGEDLPSPADLQPGDLVILDSPAALLPGRGGLNDYAQVARWLKQVRRLAISCKVTIILILHSSKVKEGESYKDPRQKILGSAAWGAHTDFIAVLEQESQDNESSRRLLWLMPREAPNQQFLVDFDNASNLTSYIQEDSLEEQLIRRLPDGEFTTAELTLCAESLGICKATRYRLLERSARIKRIRRGTYKIISPSVH